MTPRWRWQICLTIAVALASAPNAQGDDESVSTFDYDEGFGYQEDYGWDGNFYNPGFNDFAYYDDWGYIPPPPAPALELGYGEHTWSGTEPYDWLEEPDFEPSADPDPKRRYDWWTDDLGFEDWYRDQDVGVSE